jgi:beta-glucoside operon transcriptional antiterminator
MIIKKVFNNNAVAAISEGKEIILTGNGIGFGKKYGDNVDESKIEKRFSAFHGETAKYEHLFSNIPISYFAIAEKIFGYAEKQMQTQLRDQLILDLADHIEFAVARSKSTDNAELYLLEDIQVIYPKEYEVGKYAVGMIRDELNTELPGEEIGYIAFHIVNAEISNPTSAPKQLMEFIRLVLNDFEKEYPKLKKSEGSFSYSRFIVHLRFLGNRVLSHYKQNEDHESFLEDSFASNGRLTACAAMIASDIERKFSFRLSSQEKLYLMIHMERIIQENGLE